MDTTHEGWKNFQTWNAALFLMNDEPLYRIAMRFRDYSALAAYLARIGVERTCDGVKLTDKRISRKEMNAMLKELRESR